MNRRQFIEVGTVALAAACVGWFVRGGREEMVENPRHVETRPGEPPSSPPSSPTSQKPTPAASRPTPGGGRLLTPGPNGKYRHPVGCGSYREDDNPVDVPPSIGCGMARMNPNTHSFLQNLTEQRRSG